VSDDLRRLAMGVPVPWDELRERRVLGKVEAELASRRVARKRRPWIIAGAAVLAAAVAVLAVLVVDPASTPVDDAIAIADAPATSPVVAIPDESALTLPDGSQAQMHTGARVDVDVQTDELVRLVQYAGVVRYEVTPNRERRFVVHADDVQVRVIGTVFTVALDEHVVRVAVERGKVEVAESDRVVQLGAGDALEIDRAESIDEPIVLEDPVVELEPAKPVASARELEERADAARVAGRSGEAASALTELVKRYPKDPRAYSAYFTLGKVERSRGRHTAAAMAFTACHQRAPAGPLAEDARAEAAVAWLTAGQTDRAAAAAQAYLDRYASGAHRARMQRILDKAR
jgi:transmembrane sensor